MEEADFKIVATAFNNKSNEKIVEIKIRLVTNQELTQLEFYTKSYSSFSDRIEGKPETGKTSMRWNSTCLEYLELVRPRMGQRREDPSALNFSFG